VKQIYVSAFFDIVKETEEQTGFEMPEPVEAYIVFLLADRVEKNTIIPDPSFAERYLELYHSKEPEEIRIFADDCLFFTSLCPNYGVKRGLDMDYFCTLGISSYYTYGDLTERPLYTQMGNWFYNLRKFVECALTRSTALNLIRL